MRFSSPVENTRFRDVIYFLELAEYPVPEFNWKYKLIVCHLAAVVSGLWR